MNSTQQTIERITDAGQAFIDCEAADSDRIFDGFRDAIFAAIRERLPEVKIVGGAGSRTSEYYSVSLPGLVSVQVRISTHEQRHSGPVWSFQPEHDARMVAMGLDEVVAAVESADEDQ